MALFLMNGVPAFAESKESAGLEQAILAVKKVVTIPAEYKEFTYNMNEDSENVGGSYWDLSWKIPESSNSINISVNKEGYILRYSKYTENQKKDGIGKVTKEMAIKTAEVFLSKARPDLASKLKLQHSSESNTMSHYLNYKLYENDIPVDFMQAYFEIDKFTGEITNYNGLELNLPQLDTKENIITKEVAKKAYLDNLGLELRYCSNYNYSKKTLTIFPAYEIKNQNKVINAKTGKLEEVYTDYRYGLSSDKAAANSSVAGGNEALTKEELSAIDIASKLISKEKAENLCRTLIPGITSSMKVTNAYLYKDNFESDQYIWNLNFNDAYASIDAKTGEVISFYVNQDNGGKKVNNISKEVAQKTAEALIQKFAGEKFAKTRLSENNAYRVKPYATDNQVTDYSFFYERVVNGIPFSDNSIRVTVDASNGNVTQYDCKWYENAKFPAVEKAMTIEKAFDQFDKNCQFSLKYVKTDKDKVSLVYGFQENVNFLLDPIKGTKMGWDGKPYRENKVPVYTDINGHWCEKTVKELLENGYYIEGDQFYPNSKMTQLGFFRFLYAPDQAYYSDEDLYKMLENTSIILSKEKAPEKELTRQDAAKFVVRYLGQAKSAEHPEIFINPFKDNVAKEYRGYAAICYGLGIMKGDKKGRFNGNNTVTHAESAVLIYQLLQVK